MGSLHGRYGSFMSYFPIITNGLKQKFTLDHFKIIFVHNAIRLTIPVLIILYPTALHNPFYKKKFHSR